MNRVFKLGTSSAAGFFLVLGILAAVNLLATRVYLRLDLTQGRIYSLSPGTKKLLTRLEDRVVVKAFFSKSLPAPYNTHAQYVRDLLHEYTVASHGRVRAEFAAADDEERLRKDALAAGVSPLQFTEVAQEQFAVKQGFMGLALYYLDRKEVIPVVRKTEGLEYDLTSRIKRLVQPSKSAIGFSSGHGEPALAAAAPEAAQALAEQHEIRDVPLLGGATVPPELAALVILGPNQRFDEKALRALDEFLLSGKTVAVFLDLATVDLQNFFALRLSLGLDDWLAAYGVGVSPRFILDARCQQISLAQRQGFFTITNIIRYPLFPYITTFNKTHPATKDLEAISLPFGSPVTVDLSKQPGVKADTLASSSKDSWSQELLSVNPYSLKARTGSDPSGPFPVVVALEGRFAPRKPERAGAGQAAPPARLIVCGSSRFIQQRYLPAETNQALFLNLLDWMTQDEDLLTIRSKGVSARPFREVSRGVKALAKYSGMFLMPAAIVAAGLVRWRMRRRQLARTAAQFREVGGLLAAPTRARE